MNLSRVRIKNFKGIEEKEFQFAPGFNLIKGENGRGKTSILEGIAVGMGGFIAGIPENASRHFLVNEIRKEYKMTGDGSCDCIYHVPVEVEMSAEIDGKEVHWLRARTSVNSSRSTIQPRDIVRLAEKCLLMKMRSCQCSSMKRLEESGLRNVKKMKIHLVKRSFGQLVMLIHWLKLQI